MSTDHRKPFLAFVVLAVLATALVGVHRADAEPGRFFAAAMGARVSVEGTLPIRADSWGSAAVVTSEARPVGAVALSRADERTSLEGRGSREVSGADSDRSPSARSTSARPTSARGTRSGARELGKAIERAAEAAGLATTTSRGRALGRRVGRTVRRPLLLARPDSSAKARGERRSRGSQRHAARNPQLGS